VSTGGNTRPVTTMVDFRVDDGFGQHPKTVGLSLEAVGLWTLAGAWSMRYLTDGHIPGEVMRGMCRRQRIIQELTQRNLITPTGGGDWQFVDWHQYQRSRTQIEAEREKARKRLADWRARQRNV
jgi:hypothetical protein